MSTAANETLRWPQATPKAETIFCPPEKRDVTHIEDDDMPRRPPGEVDYDEAEERREFRLAMLALASREATRPSELKRLWLPICAAVLISLGPPLWQANVMTRSNSDEFKTQVTELKTIVLDAKRDAADAAREAKKANTNNAMLDTYNRELERALIRKGVALPSYPVLEK